MSVLEKSYDRQLPKIGEIVEEYIIGNIEAIKLVSKEFSRCKHCIGTSHDVNVGSFGGTKQLLGGIVQGHIFQVVYSEMFHISYLKKRRRNY